MLPAVSAAAAHIQCKSKYQRNTIIKLMLIIDMNNKYINSVDRYCLACNSDWGWQAPGPRLEYTQ